MLGPYPLPDFYTPVSNGEKILSNMNVVVSGQVKSENNSLPVTVRVSKTRMLKLPNIIITTTTTTKPMRSEKNY